VLELRCDPVLTYRIAVRDVRSIERTDLEPTIWSAVRMPGLALFTVMYSDQGAVRMCATRASQDVTLVRTSDATYGLTPDDFSALAAAVRAASQRSR
jgi:PH (Pleckstrin Homology) domain-containing protein